MMKHNAQACKASITGFYDRMVMKITNAEYIGVSEIRVEAMEINVSQNCLKRMSVGMANKHINRNKQ